MVLVSDDGGESGHMFMYGQVLGLYHANIVYTGPGMSDYRPRKVEFLWVRWYEHLDPLGSWVSCTLDRLSFPPMDSDGAFSFLDPANVVRSSHIIPAFNKDVRYKDGSGQSKCARDANNWNMYYVNR